MVPHTAKFYDSEAVNFHESGKPKAKPTIIQTKRVFRQCMQFAKDQGFVKTIPVPKGELQHARSKKAAAQASDQPAEASDQTRPKGSGEIK